MKTLVKQILPSFVQNGLRRMKNAVASPATIQKYLNRVGYTVALRADYYSPLTSVSDLRSTFERWSRPSALKGIKYDLDHMKSAISDLLCRYLREFSEIPPYKQLQRVGFGPGYTAVDALVLYMMIRHIRPKRYIEVGSGLSTYYCSLAAARNSSEGYPPRYHLHRTISVREATYHSKHRHYRKAGTGRRGVILRAASEGGCALH